ncbi:Zinc finger in N-recognin family protein [Aphelenchoides avenae]|nr:Zinc finger in N-recognin family protein [Aphelenchus avenae]
MIDQLLKAAREEDWPRASELLYEHWSSLCPTTYTAPTEQPWENRYDESKINENLLHPIAAMFCGEEKYREPHEEASIRKLTTTAGVASTQRRPGQICGRVFRNGEPTYTCKECATDGTCVLCHECFKNSEHAKHKYKLHASNGGGYCDCGDQEAWSRDYACRLHTPEVQPGDENQDLMPKLPRLLESRVYNLSCLTMRYVVNLLCWENTDTLPSFIDYLGDEQDEVFQTILYNDETHTYDAVIRALEIAVHCTENQAMRLATIVDREGRAVVKTGSKEICEAVRSNIQRRTQRDTNRRTQKAGPLEVKVTRASIVAHQIFAVRLLNWLTQQTKEFPPLSLILGDVLLYECAQGCRLVFEPERRALDVEEPMEVGDDRLRPSCGHSSSCLKMMLHDRKLWKSARAGFHQMLMSTVLMDLKQKQEFGRLFVRNYNALFEDFIDDDHDHNVSIVAMSVQVFTVPTVARLLITEENAVDKIISGLIAFCQRYVKVSSTNDKLFQLDFSAATYPAVLKRALYMFHDVQYLLTMTPRPEEWNDSLRMNFLRGGSAFLRFLRDVQGMDEVKRQFLEHQIMESEWETAFNIFIRMSDALSMMISWGRTDPLVHMNLSTRCLVEMESKTKYMPEFESRVTVEVNGFSSECIEFDVSKQPLSVHQPLWRFLAGLFTAPPDILANYVVDESGKVPRLTGDPEFVTWMTTQPLVRKNLKDYRMMILEMPLRVLVLFAQANAQLWRRNGFSLVNQVHNYASPLCRTEMFDRDIILLQIAAATMSPEDFLIRVLDRFGLIKWAGIGFEDMPQAALSAGTPSTPLATQEDLSRTTVILAEEMFHLLVIVLGERYVPGVGQCTLMQSLQREIVHLLCTGPKPFSVLERVVPNDPSMQRLSLEDAVREVADFRKPAGTSSGSFYLKKELLKEYNSLFYHYAKQHVSQAEQHQKKLREKEPRELAACPPPHPPLFEPFYRPITHIMGSPLFAKLVRVVFERFAKRSRFASDSLLHRALFLTGMALNEQLRENVDDRPKFTTVAKDEGILELMTALEGKPEVEVHADLLWWTIQRFKAAEAKASGVATVSEKESTTVSPQQDDKSAKKSEIAARKREAALERMRKLQQSFKNQNKAMMDTTSTAADANESLINTEDEPETGQLEEGSGFPVACGPQRSKIAGSTQRWITCILCQEDEVLSYTGKPVVCAAYVQESRLFAQFPNEPPNHPLPFDYMGIFAGSDLHGGTGVSTCSHTMHFDCYNTYATTHAARERNRRQQTMNPRMLDYDSGEYLCPLCKRLSNCALPLFPVVPRLEDVSTFTEDRPGGDEEGFDKWVTRLSALAMMPIQSPSAHKPTKTHGRKRSHSERSLLDMTKKSDASGALSSLESALSTSQPSVASMPLAGSSASAVDIGAYAGAGDFGEEREMQAEQRAAEEPAQNIHDFIRMSENVLLHYVNDAVTTLKNIVPTSKGMATNLPSSLTTWSMVAPFVKTLIKSGSKYDSLLVASSAAPENVISELAEVYKATAFMLRSITTILKIEKKPLFGAFNTRQKDCINAMIRLAALIAFNTRPVVLRALVSRLLTPLLIPFSQQNPFSPDPDDMSTPKTPAQWSPVGSPQPTTPQSSASAKSQLSITRQFKSSVGHLDLPPSRGRAPCPAPCRSHKYAAASPGHLATQALLVQLRDQVNILNLDMLTLATELLFTVGWTWTNGEQYLHAGASTDRGNTLSGQKVPSGSVDELYAIRLCLLGAFFQVFACFDSASEFNMHVEKITLSDMPEDEDDEYMAQLELLDERILHLYRLAHNDSDKTVSEKVALRKRLYATATEFLRPLAILYNALTLVPPPEALKDPSLHEFEPLCRYLGLPHRLQDLLDGSLIDHLFTMWSAHIPQPDAALAVPHPVRIRLLIDLPNDYSELINQAASFRCPSIQVEDLSATVPTLCLVCGKILCSQSYCCQQSFNGENVGACTYHMSRCSGSSGVFLRIRDCQVVFLTAPKRGCHKAAPYVDEFGETDSGFRRGNPLHLNADLYWKIQRLWLHQEIAEEVLNQYEINHRNIAFEWQHF